MAVTAEIITTARMMDAPSSQPYLIPCMITPKTRDRMAAAHRIRIVSSSNVAKIISVKVLGGLTMGALVAKVLLLHYRSLAAPDTPFFHKINHIPKD